MDFDAFAQLLRASLPLDLVLKNPGRGTSTIVHHDNERICYRRGKSRFCVGLGDLHEAYTHFAGGDGTTRQLKEHAPHVFDSAKQGHNCHASFLFLILQQMGLAGEIWGRGQVGSPFGITIALHRTTQ